MDRQMEEQINGRVDGCIEIVCWLLWIENVIVLSGSVVCETVLQWKGDKTTVWAGSVVLEMAVQFWK